MPSNQILPDPEPGPDEAAHRDDTMADQAEGALEPMRANETYLRLALEGSAAGTWAWDVTTDQVTWDERWAATYGLSADEPPSQSRWLARIHPVDRARVLARLEEMRRPWGGDLWEIEFRVVLPDGRIIWIEDRGRAERDANGRLLGIAGINLDITRRKSAEAPLKALANYLEQKVAERTADLEAEIARRLEAEAALRASEERLRTIYRHAPMGIIQVDPAKGALEMVNPAFCDMLGYSEAELTGRPLAELTHPDDWGADREGFRRIMAGDIDSYQAVKRYIRRDGTFVWAQVHAAVLRDPEGRARFNVAVVSDITDLRQAEEAAREHLEEASRLQRLQTVNELATLLAHELNQPLAAIATYTEVGRQLLSGASLDQARLADNLDKIGQEALRAGDIIRHLRRFVRRRRIDPEPVDLHEVVRGACQLMAPEARKGGIRLELRLDPNPPLVFGVSVQLEQVLLNLLRNAFDAIDDAGMQGGTVTVTTRRAGDKVLVTVSDSGPGIDAASAARLFEPLSSRKVDGLGVGLRISRGLIEAHGGRLWVEPQVPGGVFHFELFLVP